MLKLLCGDYYGRITMVLFLLPGMVRDLRALIGYYKKRRQRLLLENRAEEIRLLLENRAEEIEQTKKKAEHVVLPFDYSAEITGEEWYLLCRL